MADRAALPTDDTTEDPEPQAASTQLPADVTDGGTTIRPPSGERPIDEPLPDAIPRSVRSVVWQARAFGALSLLLLLVCGALFVQNRNLQQDQAAREDVLAAGVRVAARFTTYVGVEIDDWVADAQRLSTQSFAQEIAASFDQTVREGLAANEVESAGEVLQSFVQEVRGDTATVFAVVRQTYTSPAQPQPISDELRMEIVLVRSDDEWLADDVGVLGPSVITPAQQAGETVPGDPGADPESTDDETG